MRRGKEAQEARRQRAAERLAASKPVAQKQDRLAGVPDRPEDILEFAATLGWTATRVKNGWRLTHPSGETAMLHLSISDYRAWRNIRADLLRAAKKGLV